MITNLLKKLLTQGLPTLKMLRLLWPGLALLLIASRTDAQTLINAAATWKYFKGTAEASAPTNSWRALAFNDASWSSGPAPFRYGAGVGGTELGDMANSYPTVFLRRTFAVTNAAQIQNLRLSANFDDGFVVWLNGTEIFRANASHNLAFTSLAPLEHQAGTWEIYTLPGAGTYLVNGSNAVAVECFNTALNSDDFHFDLQLESTLPQPTLQDTEDTNFSVKRGFCSTNFTVTISSATSTATIIYTLDGSDPRTSALAISAPQPVNVLIDPDSTYGGKRPRLTPGVTLRAYAHRVGRNPSNVDTQTYLFLNRIRNQTNVVPATTNFVFWDTVMDQRVVTNTAYSNLMDLSLQDIPTMSIVMDWEQLFGTNGVHRGNNLENHAIEMPCSMELIYPPLPKFTNFAGFQVNCGIKIQGGGGRWNYGEYDPKQSFTLMFQPFFDGPGRLKYPLFEAAPVNRDSDPAEYNRLILRDGHNKGWAGPGPNPRQTTVYTRDEFHRASMITMAGKGSSAHGTFVHLYLNGLYWGLYNPTERPDHGFQSIYFGGDSEHYDSYKQRNGNPNGDTARLTSAKTIAANTNTPYATVKEYVDTAEMADFMIVLWASGGVDGPQWYAGNGRNPFGPVRFFHWDYEDSYQPLGTGYSRGGQGYLFSSANTLWQSISLHPEFKVELADRIYKHCFNDGVFTDQQNTNRWLTLCSYIENAVIAESARWGDEPQGYREGSATPWPANTSYNAYTRPLNRNDHWYSARDQVTAMMATNTAKMLADLRPRGYYPATSANAPLFTNVTTSQRISVSRLGFTNSFTLNLSRDGTTGTIYWTSNGVDPRAEGGNTNLLALNGGTGTNLFIAGTTTIRARLRNGTTWSPLHQLTLHAATNDLSALKLTEIMYHPAGTELANNRAITNIIGNAGGADLGRAWLQLAVNAPSGGFSAGDNVIISGSSVTGNNGTFTVDRVSGRDVYLDNTLLDETPSPAVAKMELDGDRYEFVELKNTGATPLNLSGVKFTAGIQYDFPDGTILAPGQFWVLTSHRSNFRDRNPAVPVNGFYMGALDNGGERLTISDYFTNIINTVKYDDATPWPVSPDGLGYSLVPLSSNPVGNQDVAVQWRASQDIGGSPGADDPVYTVAPIKINEVLAHTDPPLTDAIELYNPTAQALDLGGWYLTDNRLIPQRWQIPAGTTIPANGYLVIYEGHLSGETLLYAANEFGAAFSLSSVGEEVYLFSPTLNYSHGFEFEASFNGVSFGRYVTSVGEEHLVSQTARTLGAANAGPIVGPVVISEINYHPGVDGDEFIELENITSQSVALYDSAHPTNAWKLGGVSFEFAATNVVLPPHGLLLLVQGDSSAPAAFRANYNVPANVPIFNFTGALDNNGETLALRRPDAPNVTEVPYAVADRIRYSDQAPWPLEADGLGYSLERFNPGLYGNDLINWRASLALGGTPGVSFNVPTTPLIATDVTAFDLTVIAGTNPDLQELNIWNNGVSTLYYRITSTNGLPSVVGTPDTGSSIDAGDRYLHYLHFNTAGLPLGNYQVAIEITDNGSTPPATNSPAIIPVTIHVVPAPLPVIGLSVTNLAIQALEGSNPGAVNFNVFNAADDTLQYTLVPQSTWLTVSPTNGASVDAGDPRSHIVTLNTTALAAGNYSTSIQILSPTAINSPQTIPVSLEVIPIIPAIGLSVSNLSVQVSVGSNATAVTFNVFNAGNGTLNYTLAPQAGWFTIAPSSGTSTSAGDPKVHTITFNSAALPAGTFFSWIEVGAPGAVPAAAYLPVVLQVREGGEFTAYNDFSWGGGQLSSNITTHTTAAGGPGDGGGELIDHATGQPAGVTLAITGGSWLGAAHYVQGANANPGTDAADVFSGKVDCTGVLSYETNELVLTFSNLLPSMRYEVVIFGNRAQYNDRFTTVTLAGAANFTNISTAGATLGGGSNQTTRSLNGNNTISGYVARYAAIDPGADGVFMLRTLPGITVAERYYLNALMLQAGEPPVPQVQLHSYVGGQLALTWDGAGLVLEEASVVSGPWTPCASQSAVQAVLVDQPAKFFRLRSP